MPITSAQVLAHVQTAAALEPLREHTEALRVALAGDEPLGVVAERVDELLRSLSDTIRAGATAGHRKAVVRLLDRGR
jgi:hypothetical protein